jgi:hypothetical protein
LAQDLGERRFEWLLRQRGIDYVNEDELEQRIEVRGRRPDYYAWTPSISFLTEVKTLTAAGPFDGSGLVVISVDHSRLTKRLSEPFRVAAEDQLKPYQDLGIPMLVIFDNHKRVGVGTSHHDLIHLFGEPEIHILLDITTGETGDPFFRHGRNQALSAKSKTYISAIGVNLPKQAHVHREPVDAERPMRIQLVHNPFATVPFPMNVFNDPEDEHHMCVEGRWVQVGPESKS